MTEGRIADGMAAADGPVRERLGARALLLALLAAIELPLLAFLYDPTAISASPSWRAAQGVLREAAVLEGARPVIILCATENDHQQFVLAKAAGAAHHILKPFDKGVLAAKLAEIGLIDHPPVAANA